MQRISLFIGPRAKRKEWIKKAYGLRSFVKIQILIFTLTELNSSNLFTIKVITDENKVVDIFFRKRSRNTEKKRGKGGMRIRI